MEASMENKFLTRSIALSLVMFSSFTWAETKPIQKEVKPATAAVEQKFTANNKCSLQFVSKITAGSFTTKSSTLDGSLTLDATGKQLLAGEITVPVTSLDSSMSIRNEHMQKKYLECEKFPSVVFTFKDVKLDLPTDATIKIPGEFTIHGVTKPVTIDAAIKHSSPEKIEVKSHFPINITDYGIDQPKFAVVKMDTVVDMNVELTFEKNK